MEVTEVANTNFSASIEDTSKVEVRAYLASVETLHKNYCEICAKIANFAVFKIHGAKAK